MSVDRVRLAPLLTLLRKHESASNYDAVSAYIKAEHLPPRPVTQMTLGEVNDWQYAIDSHYASGEAAGAYQFIKETLKGLIESLPSISRSTPFSKSTQDLMAIELIRRRGLEDFLDGKIAISEFGNRLAMEWAALPVLSDISRDGKIILRGASYYTGDKWNRALVAPGEVETTLVKLRDRPQSRPVLEIGDKGAFVLDLQYQLKDLRYHLGSLDADFGPLTRAAVLAFQADNGLLTDGVVDQEVWEALTTAEPRPERDPNLEESRTIKDAEKVQEVTKNADKLTIGAAVVGLLTTVLNNANSLSELKDDWPFAVFLLVVGIVLRTNSIIRSKQEKIKSWRTEDAQTGRNLGR